MDKKNQIDAVNKVFVPFGAEAVGSPAIGWRVTFGKVGTVGQLKEIIEGLSSDMPLMVRNCPIPTLHYHFFEGIAYLELEFKDLPF